MNAQKVNEVNNPRIGAVGKVERVVRTVIGFSGLLAVIVGVATNPLQYFVLSALGIYLIHTVIIGLDPFYAAAHYLRVAIAPKFDRAPLAPRARVDHRSA